MAAKGPIAARAGGAVSFVNCVGDDRYGAAIVDNLRAAQIDVEFVAIERDVASGTALVMIGGEGDNYLSVAPDTLEYAIDIASELRRPIMLNLAPARPLAEGRLRKLTYLIVNESEAEFLCGFPVDGWERAVAAAEAIRRRGPVVVIVTLGVQGACVASGSTPIHIPAFPVTAVDATAAGVVFCGSLAVALVEGKPLTEGVRFASAAAAIAVTRLGARPSIPGREEIERFLRDQA